MQRSARMQRVSTHSRPKAAGENGGSRVYNQMFQLTAARRRLAGIDGEGKDLVSFQLTAARRRLVPPLKPLARKACITLFR